MKKKNIGGSFDDWLREEGLYEEATAVASEAPAPPSPIRQFEGVLSGTYGPAMQQRTKIQHSLDILSQPPGLSPSANPRS